MPVLSTVGSWGVVLNPESNLSTAALCTLQLAARSSRKHRLPCHSLPVHQHWAHYDDVGLLFWKTLLFRYKILSPPFAPVPRAVFQQRKHRRSASATEGGGSSKVWCGLLPASFFFHSWGRRYRIGYAMVHSQGNCRWEQSHAGEAEVDRETARYSREEVTRRCDKNKFLDLAFQRA